MRLPTEIQDVNVAWLNFVLKDGEIGPVSDAKIVEVIHGTATKIHVELTLEGPAHEKKHVWIKTGFEAHSANVGKALLYAGEVHYYQALADLFDTRTPKCYFAASDPETGNSAIVLDDLCERGALFLQPTSAIPVDGARRGLATLARIHALSWMNPLLAADPWLASGGAYIRSNALGWLYSDENWSTVERLPRFKLLPEALRSRALLSDTHAKLVQLWRVAADPYCLSHGDMHIGQAYELPNGEVEFLDWQLVTKNSWANDVAMFIVSSLSIADRRAHERDLLKFYLSELFSWGVQPPTFEEALKLYRAYAFKGIGWIFVKSSMQSEENALAIGERVAAAIVDLESIATVQSGPDTRAPQSVSQALLPARAVGGAQR